MPAEFKNNSHVRRILRVNESYEERCTEHDDGVETKSFRFLRQQLLEDPPSLIVLTGDAGHGKTHLCRKLIQLWGYGATEAIDLMRTDTKGLNHIPPRPRDGRRSLRIVKDLSEIEPKDDAVPVLRQLMKEQDTVAIVCANEGRLRDVLASPDADDLSMISKTLSLGLDDGVTSVDPSVHVINLNFQSVTGEEPSFVESLLQTWVQDNRRWRVCSSCAAEPWCPIRRNQALLAGESSKDQSAAIRRAGVNDLLRLVEQSGYVLTIRETLVLLAYALTGGRSCAEVARDATSLQTSEQTFADYLFDGSEALSPARPLPVLKRIRRLEPGSKARRDVDDGLQRQADEIMADAPIFRSPPRTRGQTRERARGQTNVYRRLRRIDFFEKSWSATNRAARLGFLYHRDFEHLVSREIEATDRWMRIRDQLVAGLHVVQGLRPRTDSFLFLADPSFAKAAAGSAIVSARVPINQVVPMGREAYWRKSRTGADRPAIVESVDWVERGVVVQIAERSRVLDLDLVRFECVMRAGGGVAQREFFGPEIRHTLAELATLVESSYEEESYQIELLVGSDLMAVQLDVGGRMRVGEF